MDSGLSSYGGFSTESFTAGDAPAKMRSPVLTRTPGEAEKGTLLFCIYCSVCWNTLLCPECQFLEAEAQGMSPVVTASWLLQWFSPGWLGSAIRALVPESDATAKMCMPNHFTVCFFCTP